jgi:MFS family permease
VLPGGENARFRPTPTRCPGAPVSTPHTPDVFLCVFSRSGTRHDRGRSGLLPAVTRHPAGLKVIFMAEMWERFSYYGMRALLVLYLVNALGYQRSDALQLYGLYTGLVYLTPLLGGYLADRWIGTRLAMVIGGVVMMLGHFAMAFEPLLHVALGLLIVGNGFFKPNSTSLVGMLYEPGDPRCAGGYTIFYMGVNVGAFFSPLVAGTLGERLGWHWGFASAGVGMAFGIIALLWRQQQLGRAGLREGQAPIGWADAAHRRLDGRQPGPGAGGAGRRPPAGPAVGHAGCGPQAAGRPGAAGRGVRRSQAPGPGP